MVEAGAGVGGIAAEAAALQPIEDLLGLGIGQENAAVVADVHEAGGSAAPDRADTRNVKRWQGGSMVLRWASAAVLDGSKRFRRSRDLQRLFEVLQPIETEQNEVTNQQVA